jgi:hypothetical protein
MQITLFSFLFKNCNIIKKAINKDTLKLYALIFHLKYTQRSAFKALASALVT